jgi:hypothetical protein
VDDSPKIHIDDVHVSVRPEEIDSILSLRDTFDYFEIMGNYVSSYLELGWVVKLVIPQLDMGLDIDFRQVRDVWNQGLTDLAVKGIHTCLMVYTGAASNLMVLEVQGKEAERALFFGRDWRGQCIIQVGEEREQHFFTWPGSLTLPNQTALEKLDIQVYGEGGRVTLPPSLVPGVEAPIRWLVPPWESPPCPPTPRLYEFLQGHFPRGDLKDQQTDPDIPVWEDILAHIASHTRLMQTLLTPASDSEEYYRNLVAEAQAAGLRDQRLLLGLLWHAPLGKARHESQSLEWFKNLIKEREDDSGIPDASQIQKQLADLVKELSRTLAGINKEREDSLKDTFKNPYSTPPQPDQFNLKKKSWPILPQILTMEREPEDSHLVRPQRGTTAEKPATGLIQPSIYTPGEIPVDRKKYEAMIYELGRLGGLQKVNDRTVREANSLKEKVEAQRQDEINHLRQLVREKKDKKWW